MESMLLGSCEGLIFFSTVINMFGWLKTLVAGTSGSKRPGASGAITSAERRRLIKSLDDLLRTPGKACYQTLTRLASATTQEEFTDLVHCPALVGSAIRDGELMQQASAPAGKRKKTQVFSPSMVNLFVQGGSIEQSIFLFRKPLSGVSSSDMKIFRVGRDPNVDILMVDFAISGEHAVIKLESNGYYLQDLASSNGTFVNGTRLGRERVLLEEGDSIRFARYEFVFLNSGELHELLHNAK
jgi:hypothetical protein